MDEVDIANDNAARMLAGSIDKAKGEAGKEGLGAPICAWCEEKIPMSRRKAAPGCTLCVKCQAAKERLKSR